MRLLSHRFLGLEVPLPFHRTVNVPKWIALSGVLEGRGKPLPTLFIPFFSSDADPHPTRSVSSYVHDLIEPVELSVNQNGAVRLRYSESESG